MEKTNDLLKGGAKIMTRQEKIDALVEDKLNYFVHARMIDDLSALLKEGWEGYDQMTDQEIDAEYKELEEQSE